MCYQCNLRVGNALRIMIENEDSWDDLRSVVGRFANAMADKENVGKTKCPAMRALEGLTPSGSEFWEDPNRCADQARDARQSAMRALVQCKIAMHQLEIKLRIVREIAGGRIWPDLEITDRICKHCDGIYHGTVHAICGHCGRFQ